MSYYTGIRFVQWMRGTLVYCLHCVTATMERFIQHDMNKISNLLNFTSSTQTSNNTVSQFPLHSVFTYFTLGTET